MCFACGSHQSLGVHHLDGDEANNEPHNLAWACKSCNGRIAAVMIRQGRGVRARQYNPPATGAASLGEYVSALRILKGEIAGDFDKARETIHNTPAARRSEYAREIWNLRRGRGTDRRGVPF